MLFLLALKKNLYEEAFSYVKTKTNSNFVVKLAARRPGTNFRLGMGERGGHVFLLNAPTAVWNAQGVIHRSNQLNKVYTVVKFSKNSNLTLVQYDLA